MVIVFVEEVLPINLMVTLAAESGKPVIFSKTVSLLEPLAGSENSTDEGRVTVVEAATNIGPLKSI